MLKRRSKPDGKATVALEKTVVPPSYPEETLGEEDDNGTMVENVEDVRQAVVGRKIVKAEIGKTLDRLGREIKAFVITLDNGKKVILEDSDDCCAYTGLYSFLLDPSSVDHVIMGVGTTDGYNMWHIYADYGDILKLEVGWSCGNPFYYGYGFDIRVVDV